MSMLRCTPLFGALLCACYTAPIAPATPSVWHVTGDGQTGIPGYRLANPVVVRIVDADGRPIVGDTITFTPSDQLAVIEPGFAVVTDSSGSAPVYWRLGPGLGTQTLTASSRVPGVDAVVVTAVARSNLVQSIDGGYWGLCAIDMQGRLACWVPPKLGAPDSGTRFIPVGSPALFTQVTIPVDFTSRVPGDLGGHAEGCALATTGRPWCFTLDIKANVIGLSELAGSYPAFTQIVSADEVASYCGLTVDGQAWCWGANGDGQLGDGTQTAHSTPMPVSTSARFVQMDMDNHACAITSNGEAWCWGRNLQMEAGSPAGGDVTTPLPVSTPLRFSKIRIDAFQEASCGFVAGAGMYCWGATQLLGAAAGAGASTSTPTAISTASQPVDMMVSAGAHIIFNSNSTFAYSGALDGALQGAEAFGPHLFVSSLAPVLQDVQIIHGYRYVCGTAILGGATLCPSTEGIMDGNSVSLHGWPAFGPSEQRMPPVVGVPFP